VPVVAAERRAGGSVSVERVAPEAWEGIADWDEVVAEAAVPSVFLTRDWATAWWNSFGPGLDPWLLRVVADDGRTLGIVPFYLERLRRGLVRRLGLVSDRVVGSEYLGMVARRGAEAEVAQAAGLWLSARELRWDLADLSGLRDADPAAGELERALRPDAARSRVERHPCAAIALPGDFEAYLAGLGPKFRQRYRQRTNRLLRECEVRFFKTASQDELPAHLEVLFRLHQARWIEAGLPGAFADARMRSFYLDVSRRLLRAGRLRFWHLEADGAIRASQYAFAYGGVLHSLQEAFDSEFAPPGVGGLGVILRGQVLRSAIEEGILAYDFLGGSEDHKLRWGASVRGIRRVRIARSGAAGQVAWLATVGAESARESVKGALPEPVLDAYRGVRAGYRRHRASGAWR
jgi:CelD/BcsL family acetyltransferase involved in cellulose biosynthesis